MSLINNTEARFHIVPTKNGGKAIKLAPGFNDVPDEEWAKARSYCVDELSNGVFLEHGVDVKKGKEGSDDIIEGKPYHKFPFNDAEKIIKGTFYLPTLETWKSTCPSDSLRSVIIKQIDTVNKEANETRTRSEG